jgi:hypothetical protein
MISRRALLRGASRGRKRRIDRSGCADRTRRDRSRRIAAHPGRASVCWPSRCALAGNRDTGPRLRRELAGRTRRWTRLIRPCLRARARPRIRPSRGPRRGRQVPDPVHACLIATRRFMPARPRRPRRPRARRPGDSTPRLLRFARYRRTRLTRCAHGILRALPARPQRHRRSLPTRGPGRSPRRRLTGTRRPPASARRRHRR